MNPTSLAFAWHRLPDFPGVDQLDKNLRASSLRSLQKDLGKRGIPYHPERVRDMTAEEVARTPMPKNPGVEVHGIVYPLEAQHEHPGQSNLFDMLGGAQ